MLRSFLYYIEGSHDWRNENTSALRDFSKLIVKTLLPLPYKESKSSVGSSRYYWNKSGMPGPFSANATRWRLSQKWESPLGIPKTALFPWLKKPIHSNRLRSKITNNSLFRKRDCFRLDICIPENAFLFFSTKRKISQKETTDSHCVTQFPFERILFYDYEWVSFREWVRPHYD